MVGAPDGLPPRRPFIGIVGGMGPAAGLDFARVLTEAAASRWAVRRDQEQIPFVLWSVPQIPDRLAAVEDPAAPSPAPEMIRALRHFGAIGVDAAVIPCNTAHLWFDEVAAASPVPLIHIVEATLARLSQIGLAPGTPIGLLGTRITLAHGLYSTPLKAAGYEVVLPTPEEHQRLTEPAILAVKQDRVSEQVQAFQNQLDALAERGAQAILLGCTEFPVLVRAGATPPAGLPLLDTAAALAEACLTVGINKAAAGQGARQKQE